MQGFGLFPNHFKNMCSAKMVQFGPPPVTMEI